jgi:hypothetical protein
MTERAEWNGMELSVQPACWRTRLDYKIRWRIVQRPLVHVEKGARPCEMATALQALQNLYVL